MSAAGRFMRWVAGGRLAFWCPGCEEAHAVTVRPAPSPSWEFNGDLEAPTFTPSILVRSGHYVPEHKSAKCWCTYNAEHRNDPAPFTCSVCHSFVTAGQIRFLADCTHHLAGQTVPLPDWPAS